MLAAVSGCEGSRCSFHFLSGRWEGAWAHRSFISHSRLGSGSGSPGLFPYPHPARERTVARSSPLAPATPSFLALGGGKGAWCLLPLPLPRLCWDRDQSPALLTFPRTLRNSGPAPVPLPKALSQASAGGGRSEQEHPKGPAPHTHWSPHLGSPGTHFLPDAHRLSSPGGSWCWRS